MVRLASSKKNKIYHILFFLGIAAAICGASGCGTVSTVSDAAVDAAKSAAEYIPYAGGPEVRFKRKTILVPFVNETIFKQLPLEKLFQDLIAEYLTDSCRQLQLIVPGSPDFPESISASTPTKTNKTSDLALIEKGRQFGINAVVFGGVLNVSLDQEDTGILWFRETEERLRMQFSVEAFDTESGAKIFHDRFVHQIDDLDPGEIQAYKEGNPALFETVQEEINDLAEDMAQRICKACAEIPWAGYIVSVVEKKAYLSFGSDIGAKIGDVLDVHESGEVVENYYKQKFIMPGKKIGKIELIQVDQDISVGKIEAGKKVQPGSTVKIPR